MAFTIPVALTGTSGVDADRDGYAAAPVGNDCNDSNAALNPGQPELPDDMFDNDCDGYVDGVDPDLQP